MVDICSLRVLLVTYIILLNTAIITVTGYIEVTFVDPGFFLKNNELGFPNVWF